MGGEGEEEERGGEEVTQERRGLRLGWSVYVCVCVCVCMCVGVWVCGCGEDCVEIGLSLRGKDELQFIPPEQARLSCVSYSQQQESGNGTDPLARHRRCDRLACEHDHAH